MPLLEVIGMDKKFGGHYALQNVSLTVEHGEIHSLVGENGAGKSTFIKILTGVYKEDSGVIIWQRKGTIISSPQFSHKLGISVIHQERHLVPSFSGLENLYLGRDYPKFKYTSIIDWKEMEKTALNLMDELGINIPLNVTAQRMTPVERTLLEILRAMMFECKLLILDEPTASLTDRESEILFKLINNLKLKGTSIIYVSHRLDEIFRLSDRITVLRNGMVAGTLLRQDANKDILVGLMTDNSAIHYNKRKKLGKLSDDILLQISDLSSMDDKVKNVNLTVNSGEVVGIFGLAGTGRTELLETIYGLRAKKSGDIIINSKRVKKSSPENSLKSGMVLIPEDRRSRGTIMGISIRENMTLSILKNYARGGIIKSLKEKTDVINQMEKLNVKAVSTEQKVFELSGGNQQKIVFAKSLMSSPNLFLCDEPTQAVDIMTRGEIHKLLWDEADKGHGIIFVSADLQEVIEVSDRVIVMHNGRVIAQRDCENLSAEAVLQLCYDQDKNGGISND
ncbi:sugar ABC transporter ATP-binding protein [Clostridium sp.]|uniref:sugar ABC transporter ATP-binding protein n=1 Tax=Clostridium sp. TaxID=1506 RepID=UPI001A4DD86C|nr:sugar ABC transporter ATP-binding protein [Clostridium sp.]MBK5237069.1 sugar ABC transporter ATP-binding protein [Clostridium sp.]